MFVDGMFVDGLSIDQGSVEHGMLIVGGAKIAIGVPRYDAK